MSSDKKMVKYSDQGSGEPGVTLDLLSESSPEKHQAVQSLAPALSDRQLYHVFFFYHNNDRDWTLSVIEKLESPSFGFKCCCHERDFDPGFSLVQNIICSIRASCKTVIVLSPEFISNTWSYCEMQIRQAMDSSKIQSDFILVMLEDCEVPHHLTDLPWIDGALDDWWTKLLIAICSLGDRLNEDSSICQASCLVGLNPNLQNGQLLLSLKSRCVCCGREYVDASEVPSELISNGIQIPPSEYRETIQLLMSESKFFCHVWCYNMPCAIIFFTLLLGLCLSVIPLLETKYLFHGTETGLEFVHGAVVWICVLTLYMLVTHISKRKMKENTYKKLSEVNTTFIKYNLLAGVENLGLADCNKYYLHFFYFEVGPCLAYLQELTVTTDEYAHYLSQNMNGHCYTEMDVDEGDIIIEDQNRVLDGTSITNVAMQTQAEEVLLSHSGEYVNLLITKKLSPPRRSRHMQKWPCLCQYVEQRVYKMVV